MDVRRRRSRSAAPAAIVAVPAVIGVGLGFFGSAFGPYYGMAVGTVFAIAGLIVRRRDAGWGAVLLAFGIGLFVGALLYIVVGLAAQGADGDGSGGS